MHRFLHVHHGAATIEACKLINCLKILYLVHFPLNIDYLVLGSSSAAAEASCQDLQGLQGICHRWEVDPHEEMAAAVASTAVVVAAAAASLEAAAAAAELRTEGLSLLAGSPVRWEAGSGLR